MKKKFMQLVDRNFDVLFIKFLIGSIIFIIGFEVAYVKDFAESFNPNVESSSHKISHFEDSKFFVPLIPLEEEHSDKESSDKESSDKESSDEESSVVIGSLKKEKSVDIFEKPLSYFKKKAKSLDLPEDYDVDKALQGMDYLVKEQGFSVHGAAGIIGNLFSESRFNGSEVYGSHKGIAQWDVNRWPLIEDWLYINNYKEHSFLGQLIAMFESEDGKHFQETFQAMREMKDAEVAAQYFLERYEKAPGQAEFERQYIALLTSELFTVK